MNPSKIIGKGGYGVVVKEGKRARKHFRKLQHMVRELVMLRFMSESDYIARVHTHNLKDLSLTLDRWDASLQMVMASKHKIKDSAKLNIFRHVLKGLSHLHQCGIVHSDVTIANILVDTKEWRACLCDLGLTSIRKYARVNHTAEQYRPKNPVPCEGHDMLGLAISMIQLFGEIHIKVQMSAEELRQIATTQPLIPRKMCDVFIKMLPDDPRDAITSHEVLYLLFRQKTSFELPEVEFYKEKMHPKLNEFIKVQIFQICDSYRINRNIRCHKCLVQFLSGPTGSTIVPSYYDLYMVAACFVFDSLYGNSEFEDEVAYEIIKEKYSHDEFLAAIEVLIQDSNFVGLATLTVD